MACKKTELPESQEGEIEFYFDGNIGGIPSTVHAGVGGYYMETSYYEDEQDILVFVGKMKHYDNENNHPWLEVEIRNYQVGSAQQDMGRALEPGNYDYAYPEETSTYEVQFHAKKSNSIITGQTWEFGDGTTSTDIDPVHSYTMPLDKYDVCFTASDVNGCQDQLCTEIFMPTAQCTAVILRDTLPKDSMLPGIKMNYTALVTGTPPFLYEWEFEDSVMASSEQVQYDYHEDGVLEHVRLTVTDAVGCMSNVAWKTVVGNNPNNLCAAGFTYQIIDSSLVIDSTNLSQVVVTYYDGKGKTYTSRNTRQSGSQFVLSSSASYKNNEQGQNTATLRLNFNARLENEEGEELQVLMNEGKWAVAHP